MKTTKMTRLERNVFGENLINTLSIENLKLILPQLEKFVGKKIELASGKKAKGFEVTLLEHSNKKEGQILRGFLTCERNYLILRTDVTVADSMYEGGGYGASYYKKDIELGAVDNAGVLTNVFDLDTISIANSLDVVYNYEEVVAIKKEIEQKDMELRKLKNKVAKFGNF